MSFLEKVKAKHEVQPAAPTLPAASHDSGVGRFVAACAVAILLAGLGAEMFVPDSPLLATVSAVGVPGPAAGQARPGAAIGGESRPTAGAQPASPPPAFDGDVAALDWGGAVESMTDLRPGNDKAVDALEDNKNTGFGWGSTYEKAPREIVLSFYEHEPVLVDRVVLHFKPEWNQGGDVEVWTSMTSPTAGFDRVAEASLPKGPEGTVRFPAAEAKYVKVRLVRNTSGYAFFGFRRVRVFEAQRAGYVPLLTRRPELTYWPPPVPHAVPDAARASATAPRPSVCAPPVENPPPPGRAESHRVLVLTEWDPPASNDSLLDLRQMKLRTVGPTDLSVIDRAEFTYAQARRMRAWMLGPKYGYDTVILSMVCEAGRQMSPSFKQALVAWVGGGHKLIVRDSDHCTRASAPDLGWLPYRLKTNNPGNLGARGTDLRFIEENSMVHASRRRAGFVDVRAWADGPNELGDSNTVVQWDPHWCGQMVVRNANGVFGFSHVYAHYGRGLIIYDGFDRDNIGIPGHQVVLARQLAQGFDPDNLPCGAPVGDFIIAPSGTPSPYVVAGQDLAYPLMVLPNQGYKGHVTLSVTAAPPVAGLAARLEPAAVDVAGQADSMLKVAWPAAAVARPVALAVTGTDANGTNTSLCVQLGPPKTGRLQVLSALAPAAKTRRNVEFILDASGSMKTLMGKKSRWDVALETLQQVLAQLPDTFNVGLRIYGHREASTSPRTCTDSELVVPVGKLNRAGILNRAKTYRPKGETPLVYSALQAPSDLKSLGGGTVILITDGEESCKGDTVKAAADLKASGLDIRLSIVGFALSNPKTQKDLAAFSQATGGLFYAAQSGEALGDALMVAAIDKLPYAVYGADGKQVTAGEAGAAAEELPPGDYRVVVKIGARELVAPRVTVALGQSVALTVVMKNGQAAWQ